MRVLAVVISSLLVSAVADARPRRPAPAGRHEPAKRVAAEPRPAPQRGGQSIGAPWSGRLRNATRLRLGDGAHIRRPLRSYGTRTTVEHVTRAVRGTLAAFPKTHVLAIGDISAKEGGWISEHSSHRSGRDVDLGLFFKKRPSGYPASFVSATEANLDRAATWALLANLLDTVGEDGGVQVIFLDFEVQGMLYKWAAANGVSTRRLDRIFQYPHGRGSPAGIVRHEPNHDNHFHVRFRCAKADTGCY
jgi:murein endopeptidase